MIPIKNTLAGKAAVLTQIGIAIEQHYSDVFDIGNVSLAKETYQYCKAGQMVLIIENETPVQYAGIELHCFREVGCGIGKQGDLHWYSLSQIKFITNANKENI